VFASLEQPTTVTVLGKLGAMHEAAKTAAEKKSKQLSNTQLKIRGLQATTSNRQKNAKKQALLKLDEEDQKSLQQKRNTRRRMIWKQLMEKRGKQPRKRIQESFDGMDPKRVYRPKLSIQDRLEVVEWVLKKKKEMQDPEPCELAEIEFPERVGPHVSISRWVKQKEAAGLASKKKGKVRLQSVPAEVLASLDEHMSVMTSGVSSVTARNEEVMIWQIVNTAEKMCKEWNAKMKEKRLQLQNEKAELTAGVLDGTVNPQVAQEMKIPTLALERANRGKMKKSDPKEIGTSLNDHVSKARLSLTIMTSSWADCSPGPLGIHVPAGVMDEKDLQDFNQAHVGDAVAISSDTRTHFMSGTTWNQLLYSLYSPAFDKQRRKYNLDATNKGKFLADAWFNSDLTKRPHFSELELGRTALQRAVAKFTKERSKLVQDGAGNDLTRKQKDSLSSLFAKPIWMVFLPRKQKVAPPLWMQKHTKIDQHGSMVVTCKRGKPQLLELRFRPVTLSGGSEVNYVSGGEFYLSGPNFPAALVKCVALQASDAAAAPWRLEEYDDDNADEEGSDGEQSSDHPSATESAEQDEVLEPPARWQPDRLYENFEGSDCERHDLWKPEGQVEAEESEAEFCEAAEEDHGAISRPRGKTTSAEWLQVVAEGWTYKMPTVENSTLGRRAHGRGAHAILWRMGLSTAPEAGEMYGVLWWHCWSACIGSSHATHRTVQRRSASIGRHWQMNCSSDR
ncbi:unnamed protein product, partial [Durusdinium trenchii]